MRKSKSEPSLWNIKLQRRREFCERFVRQHHPEMADANKIKGAHPLKPLDGPGYIRNGSGNMAADWWLQTDDSISALGLVWLAHLFDRHGMYDHAWMIGRSDQEAWALVSEPYSHIKASTIAELRRELERVGVELLEYPTEESTHAPGHALMLVANVLSTTASAGRSRSYTKLDHRLRGDGIRLVREDLDEGGSGLGARSSRSTAPLAI